MQTMFTINAEGQAITLPETGWSLPEGAPLYGTMAGAVAYGGVQATPIRFTRTEMFDAKVWLLTGDKVSVGHVWQIIDETLKGAAA
jgi:hypothetical protein